jgi:hypothetical protein
MSKGTNHDEHVELAFTTPGPPLLADLIAVLFADLLDEVDAILAVFGVDIFGVDIFNFFLF